MQITFVKTVQYYFEFLPKEFGFEMRSATESPRGDQWEGNVQYVSKTTYIELNCTRGENPSLWIGRTKDKDRQVLSIQIFYEYMNLTDDEKNIVLSISNGRQAAGILASKQLLRQVPNIEDKTERKKLQIEYYARSLRQYGLPFLHGNFSQWLSIWEYQVEKLTVENARAGRPDIVPIVVTDENGQFKVVGKESIFRKSLDYINELKTEQNNNLSNP